MDTYDTDPRIHALDTLSQAREADFAVTHITVRLPKGKRGQPQVRDAFINYLDRRTRTFSSADEYTAATLQALDRLDKARPDLAMVVRACYLDGQTERQAAPILGLRKSTLHNVKAQARSLMAEWSGVDEKRIELELRRLKSA